MNACLSLALLASLAAGGDRQQCVKPPKPTVLAQSISCGIPPIPPVGCRVGACVCNQFGQNCQWQFICN